MLYWRQPTVSFPHISFLLAGNSILLVLGKSASFGFADPGAAIVTAFVAFFAQYLAATACLLRRTDSSLQVDAPKLAKVVVVLWLLSLVLFAPNAIPGARWFDAIDSYWAIAAIHSGAALAFLTYYSAIRASRGVKAITLQVFAAQSVGWIVFYFFLNTALFYLFILDPTTHFWILDNYDALKNIFR